MRRTQPRGGGRAPETRAESVQVRIDWSSLDPEDLRKALESPAFRPSIDDVQALRDRAAALLLSDPSLSYSLSVALLRGVRRTRSDSGRRGSRAPEPAVLATAWRCHAEACLYTGRLQAARHAYEQATMMARRVRGGLLGQILVGRVYLLSQIGETAEATRLARRAEALLRRNGDLAYLGKLYMNRGNIHYQKERYEAAYEDYGKAAAVFRRIGTVDATWVGLRMNQAIACTNLSRVGEARRLFLETESQCRRLGLDSLCAHAKFNRAFLEALHGDYRAALLLLDEAEETFSRQKTHYMVAAARRSRAEIELELGMPAEAAEQAREASAIFSREGMAIDAALCRMDEAESLLALGSPEQARAIATEVAEFFSRRRTRPRTYGARSLQSRCDLLLGEHARAEQGARRAEIGFRGLGMRRAAFRARRIRAQAMLECGRADQAEAILASDLSRRGESSSAEMLDAWELAGRIALARGRRRTAEARFRRAIGCVERLRRLIPGAELRARVFEGHVRVYHDLLAMRVDAASPRVGEVFSLIESARARGFRDRMVSREGAASGLTEQRALLGSMTRRLEEAEFAQRDAKEIARLRQRTQTLERSLSERIRRSDTKEPGGPAWRRSALEESASRIRRDETLVEYFVVGERVLALLVRPQARVIRVLPEPASTIGAHIRRVRFQLEAMALAAGTASLSFARESAEASLQRLHAAILDPLQPDLPDAGRLLVIPHGFLHHAPFECLFDGRAYVGERYVISRLPTADLLERRVRKRNRRPRTVLVCGQVENGPGFVSDELETVASCFPQNQVRVLRDPTTSGILKGMSGCRVLHLSAHGTFRDDNPLFSRLATRDGALFLADILGARLAAELVVLSACNSGQAFTGRGDDLSGVAHGFLAAGTEQLVAGMWRLHDEATRAWMESFYRSYTAGRARDAAAAAREASIATRPRWNHPFYWGGFATFGAR